MSSRSPVRMSDSSAEDDQRKAEPTSRKWAEPQPGPSRVEPSRQGYCGYCRVLYRNLDQHLSSLRHLDAVRASSRGSGSASSASGRTKLTLLERFLQDVLQHHPHRYDDPRPSHTDLPSVSAPLLPRAELDERFSDNDSQCRGTQEHLPSSDDASCQPASRLEDDAARSQLGERAGQERLSAPIREQKGGVTDHTHAAHRRALPTQSEDPHSQSQAPPPVHRKAHRKTNRRKTSDSSSSSQPPRGPGPNRRPHLTLTDLRPSLDGCQKPWIAWQRERREAHREEAFSSDHTDPLDRTIEEVIQKYCHGVTSCQDETDSFRLSISVSMETQSEEWDSPVQVVFQRARTLRDTPVQVSRTEGRDLGRLMDTQVDVEDQLYSHQLDSALHGPGDVVEDGFWALPIEEVRPAPERIPESFRGKTWTQIEQEDEEKVERLVRQFRRGRFICYFDTESLARYGRRSQKKKEHAVPEAVEPDAGVLPLMEQNEADSLYVRRRRGRRRGFRLASRCQVVKVSHSTQTVRLVIPAVHQLSPEAQPTGNPEANQEAAERTPDAQTWRSLPSSYSSIITPVQPGTSLVYLLSSPSGPTPTCLPTAGSAQKHCRKKRRPLDQQGLKVKYKRLPVKFYDPTSNRVLKNPPRGFLWHRSSSPSGPPPPCVRQLFRSLSPDLNTDKPPIEVKGHSSNFLLSTLTRDSAQTDTSQAPPLDGQTESRRDVRRERTRPPSSQRRTRAQATPPPPRREALRRAGPGRKLPDSAGHAPLLSSRRGRGRRPRR